MVTYLQKLDSVDQRKFPSNPALPSCNLGTLVCDIANGTTLFLVQAGQIWVTDLISLNPTWDLVASCGNNIYGSKFQPSASNSPPCHGNGTAWQPRPGVIRLFGGTVTGALCDLNDFWEYSVDTGMWTWLGCGQLQDGECQNDPTCPPAAGITYQALMTDTNPNATILFSTAVYARPSGGHLPVVSVWVWLEEPGSWTQIPSSYEWINGFGALDIDLQAFITQGPLPFLNILGQLSL